jgi:hypothetical protein
MRVTIEHHKKTTGGLRAIPQVEVIALVAFSEEERLIIESRRLEDYVVLQREPDSRQASKLEPEEMERWAHSFHLRIGDLLKSRPDRFTFDTPADAKIYQQRLTEALKQLKAFIMDNANLGPPTSFEL